MNTDTDDDPQVAELMFLSQLANHVPAMLAYWDAAGRCRFANHAYENGFAVPPDSVVGRSLQALLGPAYTQYVPRASPG